ncbi:MAG: MBL fold metallo-hydrolase, partial [Paracoccaceae bacterium]|nr:MBL fold metallo-hydrolase [Paracoccaceae bacterium]
PKTAAECFPPMFKRSIGEGEYGLALVEALAHMNHLYQQGDITRTRRDDGAWLWQTAN